MSERASSVLRSAERLGARRRRNRRRALVALGILFAMAIGAGISLSWRDSMRIVDVKVYGGDQALAAVAMRALEGTYLGIVPRNSTFFFPETAIRRAILDTHPEIAALSLFRNGFTGLSMKVDERTAVARWCGLAETPGVDEYCYLFDPNGYVFAPYATSTDMLNRFRLYVPLEEAAEEPLRATLAHAEKFPATFDFARRLGALGSIPTTITIADGEVTDTLGSGTKVVYLLGDEHNAITALVSSGDRINLSDGSIEYVDLRFDGKVYLKKRASAEAL